jgi:hypothetical protein
MTCSHQSRLLAPHDSDLGNNNPFTTIPRRGALSAHQNFRSESPAFLPPVCQINGRRIREPHRRANSPSRHAAWCLRVCGLRAGWGRKTGRAPSGRRSLSGGKGRPRDRRRVGTKARRKVGQTPDAEGKTSRRLASTGSSADSLPIVRLPE